MVAKSVKWVLAGLMVSPSAALALGLGDIHLLSTLNAPLDANIDLIGASSEELASLTPKIASRETFAQHGLDWPNFLANVTVRAVHSADGRDVLELRSTQPVTEPFLTLLVELDWDRGHFMREYTVLLDPPVYTPNAGRAAHQPVEAPTSGASANEGTIQRGSQTGAATSSAAPSPGASPGASGGSEPAPSAGTEAAGARGSGDTYVVRHGDTLSHIATRLAERGSENRWMVAAFQANPDAFDRNMNRLRSGSVLRIPSTDAVAAVSAAQASGEVHRQYAAWRGTSGTAAGAGAQPGRLRLVAPGQSSSTAGASESAGAAGAGGRDTKALEGEVQSLQAQLDESRRLLEMRNAQLAQLQAKLAARESAAAALSSAPGLAAAAAARRATAGEARPPAAAAGESAATSALAGASSPVSSSATSAEAPNSAAAASSVSASSTAASPPAASPLVTAASPPMAAASAPAAHHPAVPKPVRHPAASPSRAPESSFFDSLGSFLWVGVLAIAALVGFFLFRSWTSRRKAGFDDSLGRLAEAGATSLERGGSLGGHDTSFSDTAPLGAPKRESSFLVEESGTHERPRFEDAGGAAPAAPHVESDDAIGGETALNLDQGDPLAEADFHMAYGLYDQAADLVRIAIQREPERRDLRLKLLEVFFVWGNKEQFLATARDLAATRAQAAPGEWEKIVIMGKQLAPEDPLFAGGAAVSGAAAGGVDLDLEGGQNQIDFDVLGGSQGEVGSQGVDLDIGTAIGERDPAAETAAQQATDRNLALDSSLVLPEESTIERAATPTQIMTQQMTQQLTQRLPEPDAATGTTREMTARTRELAAATREMTATLEREGGWDAGEAGYEGPTVEQPTLSTPENPTIRQKVEMALRAGATDHTAELALDDLGLDLTALAPAAEAPADSSHDGDASHDGDSSPDTIDQPGFGAPSDAPTLVAGLDERSRRLMETAELRATARSSDLKVSETGTWHFDADPFAGAETEAAVNGLANGGDLSDTSRLKALKAGTVDFEIGEPETPSRANGHAGVDLDVGTATVPDAAFTATQRLGSDDLALPDLDPITMSEVGTKLDLARAYMDMGDPEGARNILEEVLNEGSVAQRQEAQKLIASLPG